MIYICSRIIVLTPIQNNVSWIVYGEEQKVGSVIKRQDSQATSEYEWLQITTSNYQSSYEWLQLRLVITLDIKTLWIHNVSNDYTTANVVNTLKSVFKIVALHFWWKSLKNDVLIRLWNLMIFFCGYIIASKFVKFISDDHKFTGDYFNLSDRQSKYITISYICITHYHQ